MDTTALQAIINEAIQILVLGDEIVHGFQWSEIGSAFKVVVNAPSAIADASQALAEYKALDSAARAVVDADIAANCAGFQDAGFGATVQGLLMAIISIGSIISMFEKKAAK